MAIRLSIFVSALFCSSAYAAPSLLYGILTQVIDSDTSTAIYSVSLDPKTGAVANVSENFFYNGGSATIDGISALDQQTGVYVYATDYDGAFAYETNVYQGKLLPPLDVGAKSIEHFAADTANNRFIALVVGAEGDVLLSIDAGNDYTTTFAAVPSGAVLGYISAGFVDPHTGNYVLMAASQANVTDPQIRTYVYASNGTFINAGPIMSTAGFVNRAAVDPRTSSIVVLLQLWTNNHLGYAVGLVDAKGNTKTYPITSITDGIVTCGTFSVSQRTMYFVEARNGPGGVLHAFSLATLQDTQTPIQNGWVLESIEASS